MPNITPELGLAIAVDSDDTATYLETNLGGSLTTVDSLFNASSGHTHSGAHQGGPITSAGVADGSLTNAKLGPDVARANVLTNGGFEIWQRGNGPFTANGAFAADRWTLGLAGTDTLSVSRNTANQDAGSATCAACIFTLGTGAGGTVFSQKCAGADYGQFSSRQLTLSVRVSTTVANAVRLGIYNGSAWTYGAYHPGTGGYQTLTVTTTMASGTVDCWVGVYFSASCTAYLDNACLVVGSQPANYVPLHPEEELARVQRYYEIIGIQPGAFNFTVYQAAGTAVWLPIQFRTSKAVNPTLTKNGTWPVANCNQPSFVGGGPDLFSIGATATATGTVSFNNSVSGCTVTAEANP